MKYPDNDTNNCAYNTGYCIIEILVGDKNMALHFSFSLIVNNMLSVIIWERFVLEKTANKR